MKKTKKALIASALCTVLCAMLLFSASFAWFNATRTSGVNELRSGNLEIALSYSKDLTDWQEVKPETNDIFKVGTGSEARELLWEPGAANVVYFRIENKGSLAAKYDFVLEIASETPGTNFNTESFRLSDYIRSGIVEDIGEAYPADAAGRAAAIGALGEAKTLAELVKEPLLTRQIMDDTTEHPNEKVLALVLYMPDDEAVGAAINYPTPTGEADRPKVSLRLKLTATQMTHEADAFGSEYDVGAYEIPLSKADPVKLAEAITKALADAPAGTVIRLPEMEENDKVTLPDSVKEKTLTFKGEGADKTRIDRTGAQGLSDTDLTVTDATLVGGTADYKGFQHTKAEHYENCTFTGKTFFYGETVVCKNCTFTQNTYDYCFWTYGAKNITFENCEFNTVGKAAKVYNENTTDVFNVTFKNCTFYRTGDPQNKPAIAVNSIGATFNVTCIDCTATDFANGISCEDDAMTAWYNGRMNDASAAARQLVGCEGQLDKIRVTINGTEY